MLKTYINGVELPPARPLPKKIQHAVLDSERKGAGHLDLFNNFKRDLVSGKIDMKTVAQSLKIMLIKNIGRPDIQTNLTVKDFSVREVRGKGYTAGGKTITVGLETECHYNNNDNTVTMVALNKETIWPRTKNGANNIGYGIMYSPYYNHPLVWIELCMGSTPISLADGDLTITWHSKIFSIDI